MQEFRDLRVWQRSHRLAVTVYRVTEHVRKRGYAGLVPQLRSAAASIPANIAEGCGHLGQREFARFLQTALASAFELDYHVLLAYELGVIPRASFLELQTDVKRVKKMLAILIDRVRGPMDRAREATPKRRGQSPTTENQQPTTENFDVHGPA